MQSEYQNVSLHLVPGHSCCLFCARFNHACHAATHITEEDNSKHAVNRSETMTLRKEGEGQDSVCARAPAWAGGSSYTTMCLYSACEHTPRKGNYFHLFSQPFGLSKYKI